MRNFKKALISTLAFLLSFAMICGVVIAPALMPGSYYNDSNVRSQLSGEIDYIFNGASHAMAAFDTKVIDERLGVCSYNLSSSAAHLSGRYFLVEKEIKRNNLDTVIIDVSFDGLSRTARDEKATGEPYVVCKMDTASEKMKYLLSHMDFWNNEYENVLSVFMRYGLKAWGTLLTGKNASTAEVNKGYNPESVRDVSLSDEEIMHTYQSYEGKYPFVDENIEILADMIKLCKDNGVRVFIVVVPIAEARIWADTGMDKFYSELKQLGLEYDCQVLDFNLTKNRFETLSDRTSFCNETHMSSEGAIAFSNTFADVMIAMENGEATDSLFYASYQEMREDSPYMKIYMENKKGAE